MDLPPASLLAGVEEVVCHILGIADVGHRSALRRIAAFDGPALVAAVYDTIAGNYVRAGASANKDRSRENWRWLVLQPQISAHNRRPEVVVERAVAAACQRLGRTDWANQVPVASGLMAGAGDRRRAIDLVRRRGERHFEFIELKIASNTPLYAAIEIIVYGCLWLIARADMPSRPSAIVAAEHVDLRVLAPRAYYTAFDLRGIETALDTGVRSLGVRRGAALSFAFDVLDERIGLDRIPDDATLLACLDDAPRATAST